MKTLLFFGLLQLAVSLPVEEYLSKDALSHMSPYEIKQTRDFITDKIIQLVEKLKTQMKDGVPEMGIPPLDPLSLGDYNLGPLSLGSAGTIDTAKFENTAVHGLPQFDLSGIKMNIFNLELLLNLTFDHVRIGGNYALDGKLFNLVPIYGGGPYHVEVSNVLIMGKAKIKIRDGKISIVRLDIQFEVGHIHIHFEELMGGGDFGEELNGILQSTGAVLLKSFGPMIGNIFSDFALLKLNDALKDIDFGNVVG